jgi:hypothetical protein
MRLKTNGCNACEVQSAGKLRVAERVLLIRGCFLDSIEQEETEVWTRVGLRSAEGGLTKPCDHVLVRELLALALQHVVERVL